MRLTLPYVLGVNESSRKNHLRQVAAGGEIVEGTLAGFTRDRIRGWLFQAHSGSNVLIVRPNTKLDRVPLAYSRVLRGEVVTVDAPEVDLSKAEWLRHEQLGVPVPLEVVLDSWRGAFRYIEEDPEHNVIGLRPPQIGALHAVHAHWSVAEDTATVVMPTGTGKTDTMLAVLVSARCTRVLVVVPTDALRQQLANRFLTLGILKRQDAGILDAGVLWPAVCTLNTSRRQLRR